MVNDKRDWAALAAGCVTLALLWCAMLGEWFVAAAIGAAGLGFIVKRLYSRKRRAAQTANRPCVETSCGDAPDVTCEQADPSDVKGLVETMQSQDRYALLLRRQLVSNLSRDQLHQARTSLETQMALVPEGKVTLGEEEPQNDDEYEASSNERPSVWHVAALFLDRFTVTNRQYRHFVTAGGYEQMALWEPHIWPAVLDFVDSSGQPGPRFWKNACYPNGQGDFPVVGVSWYEATAYARWVGKRLPTDAEWVKAGSWPVPLSATAHSQRKFPWGDTMDRERCNLWGSGPGTVVDVSQYTEGGSVGGIYQLIGNVWEWTTGNFGAEMQGTQEWSLPVPMKCIRGGAFDTYFENQATCQSHSGEKPLARKHNIGFRCAIGLCDIAPSVFQSTDFDNPAEVAEETEAPVSEGIGV